MIFSQNDLEFDFENSDETAYVTLYSSNMTMAEAMFQSLEDLGLSPIGIDNQNSGSIGIEFYMDEKGNADQVESEIRDYFEESFRMEYDDYNKNFDWES